MEGLATFASNIGYCVAALVPAFCYLAALGCFLFAGWGFWRQAQPDNPFHGRPWIPVVSLLFSGVFASFDQFLTLALGSAGSSITVAVSGLTSYSTPTGSTGSLMGVSPSETLVNVVTLFQSFFQAFGALCAFFAMLSWRSVINGGQDRSHMGCVVQFIFGVALINVLAITNAVVALFIV